MFFSYRILYRIVSTLFPSVLPCDIKFTEYHLRALVYTNHRILDSLFVMLDLKGKSDERSTFIVHIYYIFDLSTNHVRISEYDDVVILSSID